MKNKVGLENILLRYKLDRKTLNESTDEICVLLDVSYSVFDKETIERIRNSVSDAEVRRIIKTNIKKL